jgi:hypothetical protein
MQQCIYQQAPYRAVGGYWVKQDQTISVPTETEMFRLLGMHYVEPQERTLNLYKRQMRGAWAKDLTYVVGAPNPPTQTSMF